MKRTKQKLDADAIYSNLYVAASKLKGLAHLVETQEAANLNPTLQQEINRGLGFTLEDISEEIRTYTANLEKQFLKRRKTQI